MSEVARYFNLNFCNPSFNSRYKSLLIWYLPDIWTTYKEIHLCLYYVWIMNTITAWPQQTLLICSPKNHYNVNKQTISWCQLLLWDIHVNWALTAHHIHCYYVKTVQKSDCFTDTVTSNIFPSSQILCSNENTLILLHLFQSKNTLLIKVIL